MSIPKMRVGLLRILQRRLREIEKTAPRSFDLGTWGSPPKPDHREGYSCGTVACVAGHAALIPEFIEKGLYLLVKRPDDRDGWRRFKARPSTKIRLRDFVEIRYGNYTFDDAGREFFGLTRPEALSLFLGWGWNGVPTYKSKVGVTAGDAADLIDRLIDHRRSRSRKLKTKPKARARANRRAAA